MNIPEYVEMVFSMPFYEFYFPDTWNDHNLPKNPLELVELCQMLDIYLDTEFLYQHYDVTAPKEGDIYFFYQNNNQEIVIYFDLHKDEFDQMAMVKFGVRVKSAIKNDVKEILDRLYFKSTTRSSFKEDYFNQSLFRIASGNIPNQTRVIKKYMHGRRCVIK